MNENSLDNGVTSGYNNGQDDEYEIVDMAKKTPLNDPDCQHSLVVDHSDRMGDYVAYVCSKCGVGSFFYEPIKK